MKGKYLTTFFLSFLFFAVCNTLVLEARHHKSRNRIEIKLNTGVVRERPCYTRYYAPYEERIIIRQPSYGYYTPAPVVVYPYPPCEEVYVYPPRVVYYPQPSCYSDASISWRWRSR